MKANKILLAASALALVGGVVACGASNDVSFELKTAAYSNDAKADINYFLNLNKDLTAVLEFENTFNGNGAMQKIAEGSWTVKNGAIESVTLGGNAQGVKDGYVQCYLSLNASGLIIAGEDDALIKLDFYFDETKKPTEEKEEKATVTVSASYEHVTKVEVYDFAFTSGPVLVADNKVTVGNFMAIKVECEAGYEVESVKLGDKDAGLQSGFYCAQADEAKAYALAITTKAAAAA
ncbi:MAG: hypothetical protein MJ238_05820 [Bacilli bacterium]|nr:hypothetical protein [Bacilli bacterium]